MLARSMFHPETLIRVCFPGERCDMKDLLKRTVQWLSLSGVTTEEIHDLLIKEGLTEYEAMLTYKGAKMIAAAREKAAKERAA
jgi:hypothetical protein